MLMMDEEDHHNMHGVWTEHAPHQCGHKDRGQQEDMRMYVVSANFSWDNEFGYVALIIHY